MNSPVLSIYIPVYNAGKYLGRCLDSVLNQTFSDFELCIYNDGSTDNSYEICQKYAKKDSRICLLTGSNGGYIKQMNAFIERSCGQYIGFVDSDDYLAEDYLERIMKALEQTNADGAMGSYTLVDHEENILPWYVPKYKDGEVLSGEEYLRRFLTTLDVEGFRWNKVYKRSVFMDHDIRFSNHFPEDVEGQFKLVCNTEKMVMVDHHGYYYRQNPTSLIATPSIKKIVSFLNTLDYVSNTSAEYGFQKEGEYYKVWRSINFLFINWKDRKKLSAEEWKELRNTCSWTKIIKKSLFGALKIVWRYQNQKDNLLKFSIKTMIVWYAFR